MNIWAMQGAGLATAVLVSVAGCGGDSDSDSDNTVQSGTGGDGGSGGVVLATGGAGETGGADGGGSGSPGGGGSGGGSGGSTGGSGGTGNASGDSGAAGAEPRPEPPELPARWSDRMQFEPPESDYAANPDLVVDSAGVGHVLLHAGDLFVVTLDPQAGWGTPEMVHEHIGSSAIAMNASDDAVAVWAPAWSETDYLLGTANYVDGTWTAGNPVGTVPAYRMNELSVSMSDDGTALAVWLASDSTATVNAVQAARFDGTSWEGPEDLGPSEIQDLASQTVAMDADGRGAAVWRNQEPDTGNDFIEASRFDGSAWSQPERISGSEPGGYLPHVAMRPTGEAIAIFERMYEVCAVPFDPSAGWGTPEQLTAGERSGYAAGPEIGFDGSGNALALWREETSDYNFRCITARYDAASGWEPSQMLSIDEGQFEAEPYNHVAVNASGQGIGVWSQSDYHYRSFWACLYDPSSGWGAPVMLDDGADDGTGAVLDAGIDSAGNAWVVWERQKEDRAVVAAHFTAP